MIRLVLLSLACLIFISAKGQTYTAASVFAHNDYVRDRPFYTAYNLQVGFIEADVFLKQGKLMVAHHDHEIEKGKDLQKLYLKPLKKQIRKNKGSVYNDPEKKLTLMIDLKTEGTSTLSKIVEILEKYPELTSCATLQFMISGSVPDPDQWNNFPSYIYFDGRPGIDYTSDQLKRISMISSGFGRYSQWKGRGKLDKDDYLRISTLMNEVREKGKVVRFWATPDFAEAWQELMRLKMDVIVTDDVTGLANFLKLQKE